MLDMTARYVSPIDFIVFFGVFSYIIDNKIMPEVLYLHQTFKDCMSDECTHFGMSIFRI